MKNIFVLAFVFLNLVSFGQFRNKEIKTIDNLCRKLEPKKWFRIKKYDLIEGDSQTKIYYSKKGLQKIIHTNFAESGKKTIIYFIINKQIVKVSEIDYNYHGYYTDPDLDKKETTEETTKSYFQNGKIFHILDESCGSPFAKDYLDSETQRLKTRYKEILALTKEE